MGNSLSSRFSLNTILYSFASLFSQLYALAKWVIGKNIFKVLFRGHSLSPTLEMWEVKLMPSPLCAPLNGCNPVMQSIWLKCFYCMVVAKKNKLKEQTNKALSYWKLRLSNCGWGRRRRLKSFPGEEMQISKDHWVCTWRICKASLPTLGLQMIHWVCTDNEGWLVCQRRGLIYAAGDPTSSVSHEQA